MFLSFLKNVSDICHKPFRWLNLRLIGLIVIFVNEPWAEFTKSSGDNFTIIAKKVSAEACVNSTQGSLTNVTIRLLSLKFSHFKGL